MTKNFVDKYPVNSESWRSLFFNFSNCDKFLKFNQAMPNDIFNLLKINAKSILVIFTEVSFVPYSRSIKKLKSGIKQFHEKLKLTSFSRLLSFRRTVCVLNWKTLSVLYVSVHFFSGVFFLMCNYNNFL